MELSVYARYHAKPFIVIILLNPLYYYPHFTDKEMKA